ncbi:MAG: DUF1993 domain-containing protein [Acetobacteraceae bacterium]|nr:DUF1993 domain-containing protein [Acetobacteraceae bacterium]
MTISMHAASVPVFKQALGGLSGVLTKAAAHAEARKIDPSVLLTERLAPDMFALTRQVQIASDTAKGAVARLAGVAAPKWEDTESSFAELQERIGKTIAYIESIPAESIDGSEERDVTITLRSGDIHFKGQRYLLNWALPNFFFHVTTAYNLLRHDGVEIGKRDFLGAF